jgi:hypothetical protein
MDLYVTFFLCSSSQRIFPEVTSKSLSKHNSKFGDFLGLEEINEKKSKKSPHNPLSVKISDNDILGISFLSMPFSCCNLINQGMKGKCGKRCIGGSFLTSQNLFVGRPLETVS